MIMSFKATEGTTSVVYVWLLVVNFLLNSPVIVLLNQPDTEGTTTVVYVSDVEFPGPFCNSYNVSGRDLVRAWAMAGAANVPLPFRHRGLCWWLAQVCLSIHLFSSRCKLVACSDTLISLLSSLFCLPQ